MLKSTMTYCTRCRSMLYWDDHSSPFLLKLGNNKLTECLTTGCNLLFTGIPEEFRASGQLDLFRLALLRSGVSEEDANTALEIFGVGHEAQAA